ncbi:MAG: AAA family ATPase, partial [Methanobrevibacter sp.]|nr:AAA family ATPase [Candidatus Methanoflexus mossambicus]
MFFEDDLKDYISSRQSAMEVFTRHVKKLNKRGEFFKIKKYLDDFLNDKNIENRFLVMPGLRGVGKTTILFQLYDYLVNEKNIDYKNILYLTMDQDKSYFNIGLLEYVDNFLDYTHKTSQ